MKNLANGYTVAQINPTKGFRIHLLVFVLTIPIIWAIWFFTNRTYLWPLWQTSAWAVGLLFHYLGVFIFKKKNH
jgi:hypothetical protein